MRLCFLLSLMFSFQVISFQSPVISSSLGTRAIPPKVKTVDHLNSSSSTAFNERTENSTGNDLDLMCYPKIPLIEPLIAAGLLDNSSRLPAKLQEKLNSRKKEVHLICKPVGMESEGEYLCKRKKFDPASAAEDDVSMDYKTDGLDEEYLL